MHRQYAKYIARHKWFVFVAGLQTGAPTWRLIIHDWSKLLPCEWFPYARHFYGVSTITREAYDAAWLHHQHLNPHHWQHWCLRDDSGKVTVLEMPEHFIREMVADWMGAGRAITGKWEAASWYAKNRAKILLAPHTRDIVEELLGL